ncbi:MAG: DedA family protein [Thermomicrobiales bacterium]|nr:DedA family protein [Thermomicrobiales bacterium]
MLTGDLTQLIQTVGYVGIFLIIFAETGLLIGFFLPGDTLLITAGFLASQDLLNIWILIPVCFVAAVTGDAVGYSFGKRVGRSLFAKERSRFFNPANLLRAEEFMRKRGGLSVIMARFIPFARTFVPIVAGVSAMPYRYFLSFNVVGALLWAVGLPLAGYFLGSSIKHVDVYLIPVVIAIIILASAPSAWHHWKERQEQKQATQEPAVDLDVP